ncbi:Ig-like domain-containing protein [Pelagicoccus albus]|uniref:Fibronectin type-III domain-containing protein n=1 Tax=Pelagicoccus albus TaxID=415222 RepID=A0A7X1E7P7_9BACT|nr:Ig-like domain-containing protein [Pelagicoccus albus]MBC2605421.1 hypothetical protein [Pelagicoccus albus]
MSATNFEKIGKLRRSLLVFSAFALGMAASWVQADEVELTWTDNSDNEEGFNVERKSGDGEYLLLATVDADTEAYLDSSAEPGVVYSYRVSAYNSFGSSDYSNVAAHYINVAPSISSIEPVELAANESASGLEFTISDFEDSAEDLILSVSSSDESVIDETGITLGGSGSSRTISLDPLSNGGFATITVSVSDGEDSASMQFLLSIGSYDYPSLELGIDTIAGQARAGESFTVSSVFSDSSDVAAVSFTLDGVLIEEVSSSPYELTFGISETGSYTLVATASFLGAEGTVSDQLSISVSEAPSSSDIVSNLKTTAIDGEGSTVEGGYDLATDTFYLEDELGVIAGTSDSPSYYYLRVEGDVSVIARLDAFVSASNQSVAGLMLRSALYGPATQASLLLNDSGSLVARSRQSRGASVEGVSVKTDFELGSWLKIDRDGETITFYTKSGDGDWETIHSMVLDLGSPVFVGFAVAAGSAEGTASASFSHVSLDGTILELGEDAREPEVPTGLIITPLSN